MNLFMLEEDVKQLTGYKSQKCQIKWLCQNGIKHAIGIDGKPRVLLSHLEQVLGQKVNVRKAKNNEPDFDGLRKYMGLA